MNLDPDTITATATALIFGLSVGGKAIHMWIKKTGANGNIESKIEKTYMTKDDCAHERQVTALKDEIALGKALEKIFEKRAETLQKQLDNQVPTIVNAVVDRLKK